jgi:Flp pilus assembly pilin Flp
MASLIAVVIIGGLNSLGTQTASSFTSVLSEL